MALHTTNPGDTKRQMNLAPFMEWTATQQYNVDDLVVSSSGVWKAKVNNKGQNPDENTFWTKVVGGGSSPFSAAGCITVSSSTPNFTEICGSTGDVHVTMATSGTDTDVYLQINPKSGSGAGAGVVIGAWPTVATTGSIGGSLLTISGDDQKAYGAIALFSPQANAAPALYLATANGTPAAPTSISNGQIIGGITWFGYSTAGTPDMQSGAQILVTAAQNINSTQSAMVMEFQTATTGTLTKTTRLSLGTNVILPTLPSTNPAILGALYMTTTGRLLAVSSGP